MESSKEVFAEGMCLIKIFWVFLFGCLFGCVFEVGVYFLKHGVWVSRQALVYGPLNPVYGFGAVVLTLCLYKHKNPFIIFVLGALLGGFVEYVCSFVQEYAFGTVSWNYSDNFLNINGRTSVFYMVIWGLLSLIYIKFIYPFISKYIEKIPIKVGNILTIVLVIFIVFDALISIGANLRWDERRHNKKADNVVEVFLDKHYTDERLSEIYENAKTVKK